MSNDGLLRVFWPSDLPCPASPGVIVGWRNSDCDLFVLSILEHVTVFSVEAALRTDILFRNSPYPIARIFGLCGRSALSVLGATNPPSLPPTFDLFHLVVRISPSSNIPEIYCPAETKIPVQIILFKRPRPHRMQYISLNPISLALLDKPSKSLAATMPDAFDEEEQKKQSETTKLVQKLKFHTVTNYAPSAKEIAFPFIINQINCAFEIDSLLNRNVGLVGTRPKRSLSVSQRVVESATTAWGLFLLGLAYMFREWIYPVISKGFIILIVGQRALAEIVLLLLEWRARPDAAALKDVSATAQQVDIRLQQFCYWPIQYLTLRKRKDDWKSVTDSHPDYIRFYNSLWLVANDVIIGMTIGTYMTENAEWVAYWINAFLNDYTIHGLQRTISWLMGWPAGLKLNTELAEFFGDVFLWAIGLWANVLASLQPFLTDVIYLMGCSSFAGASMSIAMFSDLLSALTFHISTFYITSACIFNWQLTIITSLFHLFRGRKRNVLRNRIDYCDYDLDQLLLGTILFTLLFFLLPTVVVFYVAFAFARMNLIFSQATLETCLAFLNHFPLFAFMLRIKDSKRLPGGLHFELQRPTTSRSANLPTPPISYIHLKPIPLSFREIFNQYLQLGHRLRKHYLSFNVMLCLLTGTLVPSIDRRHMYSLQYMMLPAQRISVWEVWARLTEPKPPAHKGGGMHSVSSMGRPRSWQSSADGGYTSGSGGAVGGRRR